jgi:transposase InsO family protein
VECPVRATVIAVERHLRSEARLPRSSHRGSGRPDPRPEPQTNGVIERFFGTLKYEHLYRAPIDDGGALAMETARFRDIYNRIRPHQALDDRTPR